jgi:hypothetical protein
MLNLKKTAVAVLAFGSSVAFAGTMGPVCTPGSVTVPCANSAWDFGAQALYLQPTYSGVGYEGTVTGTGTQSYNHTPNNWSWGFQIEGSYHYNTGNDVNLNWYHLNNTQNVNNGSVTVGGVVAATPSLALTGASASAKPNWDAVNLEFGQLAHFGEATSLRFHGGLEYAYIQNTLTLAGTATGGAYSASNNLKYWGVGPRLGLDYGYGFGNGFGVYAKGAGSLLAGTQSFNDTVTLGAAAYGVTGSTTQVVPELEAKLGATYSYAMAQGDLSVDLGWMFVNYFNPLAKGSVLGYGETRESNFAVQGPFVGLKWVGNVV